MAATSLHAASGAVAVGDGATAVGIGIAKGATTAGLGVAQGASAFGLGVARACVAVPAAVFGVAGPNRASEALWRADAALAGAHSTTNAALSSANVRANEAMTNARHAAGDSMNKVQRSLTNIAEQEGVYLRILFGADTANVMVAAKDLLKNFGGPLLGVPKQELYRAAKAWSTLQHASRTSADTSMSQNMGCLAARLPENSERWMRYSVAAFGDFTAGKMLGDRGAAVREKQRVRQEAVETQRQTRQDTMSTLADSVAEDVGGRVIAPTRRERREAAVTLRNERRATKMAEKAKRRE